MQEEDSNNASLFMQMPLETKADLMPPMKDAVV